MPSGCLEWLRRAGPERRTSRRESETPRPPSGVAARSDRRSNEIARGASRTHVPGTGSIPNLPPLEQLEDVRHRSSPAWRARLRLETGGPEAFYILESGIRNDKSFVMSSPRPQRAVEVGPSFPLSLYAPRPGDQQALGAQAPPRHSLATTLRPSRTTQAHDAGFYAEFLVPSLRGESLAAGSAMSPSSEQVSRRRSCGTSMDY
jgi:hypothetical protein